MQSTEIENVVAESLVRPALTAMLHEMPTRTPRVAKMYESALRCAEYRQPLVIVGELGTGKSLLARQVHKALEFEGEFVSSRCDRLNKFSWLERDEAPWQPFTDDLARAEHGVWCLEGLGDFDKGAQGRFVLTTDAYEMACRENDELPFNAVIIATIAQDSTLLKPRTLARFTAIETIPLRDRLEDIELLAARLLGASAGVELSGGAVARLKDHDWPYNVRELDYVVSKAAGFSGGSRLEAHHIDRAMSGDRRRRSPRPVTIATVRATAEEAYRL